VPDLWGGAAMSRHDQRAGEPCEVRFYTAHFTGAAVASCDACGRTWVYWEDRDEVIADAQDCQGRP
jgi:hypothetical protein